MPQMIKKIIYYLICVLSLSVMTGILVLAQDVPPAYVPVTTLAWSPDGNQIAIGDLNGDLYIRDAADFTLLNDRHMQRLGIYSLAWDPRSTQIAVIDTSVGEITIWNTDSGNQANKLVSPSLPPNLPARGYVAWSKQGLLAHVSFIDEGLDHIHLWDTTQTPVTEQTMKGQAVPFDMEWSPDGTRLAVSDQNSIYLFNDLAAPDKLPDSISSRSLDIEWSPDGNRIATIYTIAPDASVDIVRIPDGKVLKSFKNNDDPASGIAWSMDGKYLAIQRSSSIVEIRDVETERILEQFQLDIPSGQRLITWSPFGGRIVVGNPESTESGQIQKTLPDQVNSAADNRLRVIVPIASLEWLGSIAPLCLAAIDQPSPETLNLLAPEAMAALTTDQLPEFIAQVKALPPDAIPSACAADLIVVAEAIPAQ